MTRYVLPGFKVQQLFRTGRTVASHCGTAAKRIQSISAEPGGPGKKWGARITACPEQHSLFSPSTPTQGITNGPNSVPTQENPEARCTIRHPALWWFHRNSSLCPNLGRAAKQYQPLPHQLPHQKCCFNAVFLPFYFLIHLTLWKSKCYWLPFAALPMFCSVNYL